MTDFRVTIVGCGYIAQAEHIPGWRADPEGTICAVVDPSAELADLVGQRLGVPAFATMAASLERVPTSAVHICAPPHTHEHLIREAATAGVHVLVEKPLALTAASAKACIEVAEQAGITLMVCAPRQYDADYGYLAEAVAAQRLGTVHAIESFWSISLPPVYGSIAMAPRTIEQSYREGGASGLGMRLLEQSVHQLGVLRNWLVGPIEVVSVVQAGPVWHVTLVDSRDVVATHTNATPLTQSEYIRVLGAEACGQSTPWAPHFPWRFGQTEITYRSGRVETPPIARTNAYWAQIRNFVETATDGAPPRRAAQESVTDIELVEAILARWGESEPGGDTRRPAGEAE